MFQAFILYCMSGAPQTIDTCYPELAQVLQETEQECNELVISRVQEITPKLVEEWYIFNAGCNEYLPEDESSKL